MDAALAVRVLRLVGLGVRARGAVIGVQSVRDAARAGRLSLALVAADASRHSLDKVLPLLEARRVETMLVPSAAELGRAVGREQAAAVGITDGQIARGIRGLMHSAPRGEKEAD